MFTIVTGLVTLGITGALAIAFQALLTLFFTLSASERVLLGACAFLVALGIALAAVNYMRRRWALSEPAARVPTAGESTKRWRDLEQEKEEFKTKLQESEQEREKLAQENERLAAQKDEAPEKLNTEELHKRFYAQPLQKVSEANFVDERVPLDGFHYDHCTFECCTFVYRGEKPWSLTHFQTIGNDNTIEAHTPGLREFSRLLVTLKYIRPEIDVDKNLQPTHDVALGFRFVKTANPSNLSAEELKQRCLDLADELYEFIESEALDEVARAEMGDIDLGYEVAYADTETMRQYKRRFKDRVMAMLAELKQRGWWEPKSLDSEERKRLEKPDSPSDVQHTAECLEAIGRK